MKFKNLFFVLKLFTPKKRNMFVALKILFVLVISNVIVFNLIIYKPKENLKIYQVLAHIDKESLLFRNRNYIESNMTCNLPPLQVWDAQIRKMLKKTPIFTKCTKNKPLTYAIDNILLIDQTINITNYQGKIIGCEYAPVLRDVSINDNYKLGNYVLFQSGIKIVNEYIKVKCKQNKNKTAYEYVHAFIQPKVKTKTQTKPKFNVLILILDAMSKSSAQRALPKSLAKLRSYENFFLFNKHHVLGEDTFENLVPMLTNRDPMDLLPLDKKIAPPFDNYSFIWKNFSQKYLCPLKHFK